MDTEPRESPLRRTRIAMWCAASAIGAVHLWMSRHNLRDLDGICYVDLGEAYLRGDWAHAVTGMWSPFYGVLLAIPLALIRPEGIRELYAVQVSNGFIYAAALTALDFLLQEALADRRARASRGGDERAVLSPIPAWAIIALSYAIFSWMAAYWIVLGLVTPDMLVAALLFVAAAIVLRIRTHGASTPRFMALGLVLGLGYLAKTAVLPLGIVFLGAAVVADGSRWPTIRHALAALTVIAVVSMPLIAATSIRAGRLTIGETGRVNYLWHVNQVRYPLWRGEDPGSGRPKRPFRLWAEAPPLYEFAEPVGGTYPVWYDPSYWYAGAKPRFRIGEQIAAIRRSLAFYGRAFVRSFQPLLLVALLSLCATDRRAMSATMRELSRWWPLWLPALAGFGLYALVHVEERYYAPFAVFVWLALFGSVRFPQRRAKWAIRVAAAAILLVLAWTVVQTGRDVAYSRLNPDFDTRIQWQYAQNARRLGIVPGDTVGVVGNGMGAARWARLARVRVVAEIPEEWREFFWRAEPALRDRLVERFRAIGVKAVFSDDAPSWTTREGWVSLGGRNRAALVFPTAPAS